MLKAAGSVALACFLVGCCARPQTNGDPSAAPATVAAPASPAVANRVSEPPPTSANPVAPSADGFAATINRYCPIMQRSRLSATTMVDLVTEFEGQTVGFCCEDCRDAWQSMDDSERRERLKTVLAKR